MLSEIWKQFFSLKRRAIYFFILNFSIPNWDGLQRNGVTKFTLFLHLIDLSNDSLVQTIWTVSLEKAISHWTHNVSLSSKDRQINNVKDHVEKFTYTTDSYIHEAAHDNNEAEEKPSSRCAATITRMNFKVHAGEENEEWRVSHNSSSTSCVLPDTRHRTETTWMV